jgi:hypothetical protein
MRINSNKLKSLILLSLVGSNLAKEEKTDNQSELTLNSLPQIGTNFTKRENETDPTYLFAGMPIYLGSFGGNYQICLNGFPVVLSGSKCLLNGPGFLTSVQCCKEDRTDCVTD